MSRFWESKQLNQLDDAEWEALCDGCGRCCLQKLECIDSGEIFYTELACKLFDSSQCRCMDYAHRFEKVPDCISLRNLNDREWNYMPKSCAYRLLKEGKKLQAWHPLIAGNRKLMEEKGISVKGRVLPEQSVQENDFEDHIIHWIDF